MAAELVIHNASRLTVLLVFMVIVSGCCALVSFQATHLAACPPTVRCV